jgi:cyclase
MPLTVGGGIKNTDDFRELLCAGADKISVNTAAVENPELISKAARVFGSQCVVVAIDAKQVGRVKGEGRSRKLEARSTKLPTSNFQLPSMQWEVYTYGGRRPTGIDVVKWAVRAEKLGAGEILLTSMDKDGTKDGYDIALTKAVSDSVGIPVIASGGAGKPVHFYDAFAKGHADAALAASLFHYAEVPIQELKKYLKKKGIAVRK